MSIFRTGNGKAFDSDARKHIMQTDSGWNRTGGAKVILFEPIFMILFLLIYSRALPHKC